VISGSEKKSATPPIPPPTFAAPSSRARAKRILVRVTWAVVIFLVLVRIALPFVVRAAVKRSLSNALGTNVEIHDVDLSLLRGAIWIQGLRIQGPEGFNTPEPIQLVELGINAKVWSLLGKTLTIQHVTVKDPLVILERNAQGDIGVVRLVEQLAAKKAQEQQPRPLRRPALRINSLRVRNGGILYLDHKAGEQPLSTGIYEINAQVQNLRPATPDSQMPTSFELTARLLDKPGSKVKINGMGDFLNSALSLDAQLEMERLDLAHFSPYYADSPLEIRQGFVSIDAHAVCHNDMLDMPIQITFSNMDVGLRSGMPMRNVFGVPAGLAASFFLSPEATLPITAHVKGNIREPHFNLTRTIASAVSTAMRSKILQLQHAGKLAVDTGKEIIETTVEAGKETLKAAPEQLKKGTQKLHERVKQIIPGRNEKEE
jgi:uncharacterized protein involved in outer membrane biogenesis